jgi:peptidoglycan/LPS O-acetylase OafA/YrhL
MASGARLESIDMLRGLAALSVAWFHIYQKNIMPLTGETSIAIANATSAHGYLGVPAFFIISGYIIPYSLRNVDLTPANCGVYLAKRATRLLPTLAFVTLTTVALAMLATLVPAFAGPMPTYSAWTIVSNILLIAPLVGEPWILPVYWSLLIEIQYYVVIVVAMALLGRAPLTAWYGFLGLLIALPLVTPYALHSFASWSACFAIGIGVFLERRGAISPWASAAVVVAGAAATVATNDASYLAPIAITLAGLYYSRHVPRVLVWLGQISYSLYLVHYLVGLRSFRLLARFGEGDLYYWLCYAGAVLASILAAWIVFKLVEEPTMKLAARIGYLPSLSPMARPT